MNFADGLLDGFVSEPPLGDRVHALFHDNVDDFGERAGLLGVPFLVGDLQLPPLQDDFDDFEFGLVGEELVEIGFFGHCAMGRILEDLVCLQDLGYIILHPVAPIQSLVAITGDFEVLVVDLVSDGGNVRHLHVC